MLGRVNYHADRVGLCVHKSIADAGPWHSLEEWGEGGGKATCEKLQVSDWMKFGLLRGSHEALA